MRPRRVVLSGLLALAGGTAVLACGSETVAPAGDVASIVISPTTDTVTVGATTTLEATVQGADGATRADETVFWNTEDSSIATVSDAGVVTGVAPGDVRISASAAGKFALATVTVRPKGVASVVVTPSKKTIAIGETVQLRATTYDEDHEELSGYAVTWASADPDVARVNANGVATGVGGGEVEITATSEGKRGSATIEVKTPPAARVSVSPLAVALPVGEVVQLTATVRDASGHVIPGAPVTWTSSAKAIATVSEAGLVRGIAPGIANITARSGHASGTAQIAVTR